LFPEARLASWSVAPQTLHRPGVRISLNDHVGRFDRREQLIAGLDTKRRVAAGSRVAPRIGEAKRKPP